MKRNIIEGSHANTEDRQTLWFAAVLGALVFAALLVPFGSAHALQTEWQIFLK
jgi:thiol:disulfide interchange protein